MNKSQIINEIQIERNNQDHKWVGDQSNQSFPFWLTILQEEIGEASMAFLDRNKDELRKELIQVVAVGQAMIESLDSGGCWGRENN